jgi:hypothetical protein
MNIQIGDIGHIIQLAIAPVFLLTGVCTNLMVLTNRLARIIDRSRVLEDRLDTGCAIPKIAPDQRFDHLVDRLRAADLPGDRDAVPGRYHEYFAG